jgi:hypothetical protein
MTAPDPATIAAGLTPLQASALEDCCARGSTRTSDGGLVDTLLSGLCSKLDEGTYNGWLVTWHHNHPRAPDDHYISRYEPTPLGLAVRAHLEKQP